MASFARRGIMVRAGRGKFDLEASVRAYATHLREAVAAQGRPAQSGTGKERQRLAAAQADAAELKNAVRRGELVDAEAVAREWEGVLRAVRAGVLRIPCRVAARLPHLTPTDVLTIDGDVRAVLSEIGHRT
ncbi:terminase small subunit [Methylocella sp.]|uniref:terminase small subunit n=1 Tax=Methylocella sp. TaxID=1978226 RepID=UPI003C724F3A